MSNQEEVNVDDLFGTPSTSGSGPRPERFDIKSGSNVYRLIPPIKSCRSTGEWRKYYGIHFGYYGVSTKDLTKPRCRPFKCIEEKDMETKMVRRECPECTLVEDKRETLKKAEAEYKVQGKSDSDIKQLLETQQRWIGNHQANRKWHINVMNQQGQFGTLKISNRTMKSLKKLIETLENEEQVKAFDLNGGCWINIIRDGDGFSTPDTVEAIKETVTIQNGIRAQVIKPAPLTNSQKLEAATVCADLNTLVSEISDQQIRLLTKCSGDPSEVDAIFNMTSRNNPVAQQPTSVRSAPTTPATPSVTTAPATNAASQMSSLDEIERLKAQLAQMTAQKEAEKPTTAPSPVTTQNSPVDVANMSTEDFLNQFAKK